MTGAYVHANWNKNHKIDYDFDLLTLGKDVYNGKSINVQTAVGGNKLATTGGFKKHRSSSGVQRRRTNAGVMPRWHF
jgi:hypothetical protein